ncbi:uncharacterized protein involved in cysteine biosynthesis [Nitrosomonas sp. PY1]|uniref:EI24 domain-containing protein n=1 Tax=Nitrosomonas sp. PY1 TaxID=1803906 RepID=UPI001FC8671B|nr:EI24 domain-containing protein [Nitrosomonas sp. PY1]GKS69765.1 uncharacterized protein involved in cysteine biosynthesis [Nitrosomonas sp. PY1]
MSSVFIAIVNALRDLFRLRVAWIIIWPLMLSATFWFGIGYIFWDELSVLMYQAFDLMGIGERLANIQAPWLASSIQFLLHILIIGPLVIITTLIITSIFVMPALIKLVADRSYPKLMRENGGGVTGSVVNTLLASGIFIVIWIVTLPLWTIGVGFVVPFVAAAFMNQQLFRYDALSEHANKQEIKAVVMRNKYALWVLGLLTGLMQFVPILNFFAPIFTALAFIHFGLHQLELLRLKTTQTDTVQLYQ